MNYIETYVICYGGNYMAKKFKKKDIATFLRVLDALQYPDQYEDVYKKVCKISGVDFNPRTFVMTDDDGLDFETQLEEAVSRIEEGFSDDEDDSSDDDNAKDDFFEGDDKYCCHDDCCANDGVVNISEIQDIYNEATDEGIEFRESTVIPRMERYVTHFLKESILDDIDAEFVMSCNDARITGVFEQKYFFVRIIKTDDYWYFVPLDNVSDYEGAIILGYKLPTGYFACDEDIERFIIQIAAKLHLNVCVVPDENLMGFSYDIQK